VRVSKHETAPSFETPRCARLLRMRRIEGCTLLTSVFLPIPAFASRCSVIGRSPGVRHRPARRLAPGFALPFSPRLRPCGLRRGKPPQSARGWSAERRNHLASALRRPRPKRRARRLSALHRGDFCSPGPRFLVSVPVSSLGPRRQFASSACRALAGPKPSWNGPSPAGSLRSGRSAARSGPEASRCRGYEPRQQAPHPPRVSQRPAGRPSRGEVVGIYTWSIISQERFSFPRILFNGIDLGDKSPHF